MSRLNYIDQCVIFVINSVVRLVTPPEEGRSWLTKHTNCIFSTVFVKMGNALVNAADRSQHNKKVNVK